LLAVIVSVKSNCRDAAEGLNAIKNLQGFADLLWRVAFGFCAKVHTVNILSSEYQMRNEAMSSRFVRPAKKNHIPMKTFEQIYQRISEESN